MGYTFFTIPKLTIAEINALVDANNYHQKDLELEKVKQQRKNKRKNGR